MKLCIVNPVFRNKMTQVDAGRRSLTQAGTVRFSITNDKCPDWMEGVGMCTVSITNALTILRPAHINMEGNE